MRRSLACTAVMLIASVAGAQDTTVVVVRHIPEVRDTAVVVRHIGATADTASANTRRVPPRRMAPPPGPPYGTRFPARNDAVIVKDPHLAAGLSFIFPGGGQYYAENPGKGFLITALAIGAPIIGYDNVHREKVYDLPMPGHPYGGYSDCIGYAGAEPGMPTGGTYCSRNRYDWTPAAIGLTVGIGTWLYGIATAGTDAAKWNKAHNVRFTAAPGRFGFAVPMP